MMFELTGWTTIALQRSTYDELKKLKKHKRECFDEVVRRLLNIKEPEVTADDVR